MYVCEDGLDQNGLDTRRNRALTNYCSTFCRFRRFFPSFWILIPFHSQFITNNNEKMRIIVDRWIFRIYRINLFFLVIVLEEIT